LRKIPPKLVRELECDPFYEKCCITGRNDEKIEWHHNLIYASRQVNEKFCILPLLQSIHREIVKYKEKCDWIMLNRATESELKQYSKAVDYVKMRERLNQIYGTYNDTSKHTSKTSLR